MRSVLSPGWLAGHVGVVALCVAFVFLGRWQWDESQAPGGDLQNFAYAIQWWLFIAVALVWWTKVIKDQLAGTPQRTRPGGGSPAPATRNTTWFLDGTGAEELTGGAVGAPSDLQGGRRPAPPRPPDPDPELDEWNRWLAHLNEHPSG